MCGGGDDGGGKVADLVEKVVGGGFARRGGTEAPGLGGGAGEVLEVQGDLERHCIERREGCSKLGALPVCVRNEEFI